MKSASDGDALRTPNAISYKEGSDDAEALKDIGSRNRFRAAHSAGFIDKLYGVPVAANQPDAVSCSECRKPMSFLGQILSADDWFIYYLHTCDHGHEVTFHAHRA